MGRSKPIWTYRNRLAMAIALLSAAIVSFEIQLMHVFTVVQWHHFAFMVISIAMLGFGASGTFLAVFRKRLLRRDDYLLPLLMVCCGLLMTLVLRLSRTDLFNFDSYLLFTDSSQFWKLLGTYMLCILPFFCGGLAIGMVFVRQIERIGRYYFADLVGAGLGGALVIVLLWWLTPQQIPSVIALIAIGAGLLLIGQAYRRLTILMAVIGVLLAAYPILNPFDLRPSQFKGISYALNLSDAEITYEQSSPYGLLQTVSSPAQRFAPGLSLRFSGTVEPSDIVFNNGDWYAAIPNWSAGDSVHLLDYSTMALPYSLRSYDRALILNAGAGLDITHALSHRVRQVTAVEPNAPVVDLMREAYAVKTDSLFYRPEVDIKTLTPRSFLSQSTDTYDLIRLPLLGNFGGSVGLNAIHESHWLTREAFTDMWAHLEPDGLITASCWIDVPPKLSLRLAGTIAESLEDLGITTPTDHVMAIKSWGTLTFVISKSPIPQVHINRMLDFCKTMNFDVVLAPGLQASDTETFNQIEDYGYVANVKGMFHEDRDRIATDFYYTISTVSDNRPYFYQFLRWTKFPELMRTSGQHGTVLSELGYFIVIITAFQVIVLALVLIILPLFKLGWRGHHKRWTLIYFCALGLGFMFLEIVFIKLFIPYLGHPVYAATLVISVMLLSSGIGSYYSARLRALNRNLLLLCGAIMAGILVYTLFMRDVMALTGGWSMTLKVVTGIVLIALPAFFMGMPFPIGLTVADRLDKSHVPWAWGINGCVSVISTSLATIMAIEWGFTAMMLTAAFAYGIAGVSNMLLK